MPPTSSRARGPGSVPPTMTRWRLTEAEKLVLSEIGLGPEQALKKVRGTRSDELNNFKNGISSHWLRQKARKSLVTGSTLIEMSGYSSGQ